MLQLISYYSNLENEQENEPWLATLQSPGKTQKQRYIQLSGFKSVKCASVKANSVLQASLTSGFWDIYFKTVTN